MTTIELEGLHEGGGRTWIDPRGTVETTGADGEETWQEIIFSMSINKCGICNTEQGVRT